MIKYESSGIHFFLKVFQMHGSVFPRAIFVAAPCGVVSCLFVYFLNQGSFQFIAGEESVLKDNALWSGFSFLVGFLIVFRTSQSYSRFWDGCTSTHQMRAEWFDGCSSLLAFCAHSKAPEADISKFQNMLVRLFSMLHSAALAEIEDTSSPTFEDVESFKFDLIDVMGIDEKSLISLRDCEAKVELIFQWIQLLIVKNIDTGVLSIPAPILSRSFQEIATGMVAFHDAMKISQIPFPFPYAQTCDFLLMLHFLVVPFIVSQWVTSLIWAFVFSFIQVFILWVLNMIAVELENPFGHDANDIDGEGMQREMNTLLMLLLSADCMCIPTLSSTSLDLRGHNFQHLNPEAIDRGLSFCDVWRELSGSKDLGVIHRVSVTQWAQEVADKKGSASSAVPLRASCKLINQPGSEARLGRHGSLGSNGSVSSMKGSTKIQFISSQRENPKFGSETDGTSSQCSGMPENGEASQRSMISFSASTLTKANTNPTSQGTREWSDVPANVWEPIPEKLPETIINPDRAIGSPSRRQERMGYNMDSVAELVDGGPDGGVGDHSRSSTGNRRSPGATGTRTSPPYSGTSNELNRATDRNDEDVWLQWASTSSGGTPAQPAASNANSDNGQRHTEANAIGRSV